MAYMYIGGCDTNPPGEAEIKAQLEARVATKVDQSILLYIAPASPKRMCFVYPVEYGSLTSVNVAILPAAGTESISSYDTSTIYMDGVNYNIYTLNITIDNTDYTTTFKFDGVPLPITESPSTKVPYILEEPDYHGVVYARSPVVYAYRDCNTQYSYVVSIYATTGSTQGLVTISGATIIDPFVSITRRPDLISGITLDVSFLLQNFIKNDLQYYSENLIYAVVNLFEYNTVGTLVSTTTSQVTKVTLGYTHFMDGGGIFNYNEGTNAPIQVDYLMNSNQNNVPYYIPNYGYSRFIYNWKKATATNDKWRILYTNASGVTIAITPGFDPIDVAADEIQTIYCGYYDLVNTWGVTSLDYNKPIYVQTLIGTDVSYNFPLYPVSCNGNDVINLQFMNKWGVWERFFCYGRVDNSTEITYEQYKFNKVNYNYMTYDTLSGTYHKMNIQGKKKMIINTGWLMEVSNTKIDELMMSEYLLYEPYIGGATPYIITDKEVKYKTDKYDKVVNYTFTLEQAFDKINNVV